MPTAPDLRELTNAAVRLVPLRAEDAEDLYAALDDERVWAAGWGGGPAARPTQAAGMTAVVDRLTSAGVAYAVRDAQTDDLVGTVSLLDVDLVNERCVLGGAAYSPTVWGTPVNAGSNLALLGHAFEDCGLGRVEFQTDVLNGPMCGALEKMGATREGVLRRHKRRGDGTFRDTAVFSMLADEWPDVRGRLEKRLAASPATR
jgi:RimJ/RimL family protein N-acetyltransferase